jgi:putative hydrolase of the HAD superfamily
MDPPTPAQVSPVLQAAWITRFNEFLREQKMLVGLFSDYPAAEKIAALDIFQDNLWPVLCATDPDINAFKPHPKGFLLACQMWQLPPDEVLYLGDRPEVDGAGAVRKLVQEYRR